jgi:hypothetical protein
MPLPEAPRGVAADNLLTDTAPLHGHVVNVGARVGAYRRHGRSMSFERRRLTAETAAAILVNHQRRSRFLADVAGGLGLPADPDRWAAENWRMVLLRRLTSDAARPSLADLLRACRRHRRLGVRSAVIAGLATVAWLLPPTLGLRLAGTVVHPDLLQ